jgi:hypothetical protein
MYIVFRKDEKMATYKNIKSDYTFIYRWDADDQLNLFKIVNATSCDEATKKFVNYQNNEVQELTDVKELSFYKCIRGTVTPEEFSDIQNDVWDKDFKRHEGDTWATL